MCEKIYDVIVIGGGPAGYTAALYSARAGRRVAVFEKMTPGGQMAASGLIENYPGFYTGIDGFELGDKMKKGAEYFGAKSFTENIVSAELTGKVKKIHTMSNVYESRTVVIATGASPRKLKVAGESEMTGRGVSYCAACDGMFYKDKTVVIVGGGNSAASDAVYLSNICKKVYIVHRRDVLRADHIYRSSIEKNGIEVIYDSNIKRLIYDKKISGVEVESKDGHSRLIDCDGVFVAIGRVPDTKIFKEQVKLTPEGYIDADETTKTNIDGVFAAGDVRCKPLCQIITAACDGAVASHFVEEYLNSY